MVKVEFTPTEKAIIAATLAAIAIDLQRGCVPHHCSTHELAQITNRYPQFEKLDDIMANIWKSNKKCDSMPRFAEYPIEMGKFCEYMVMLAEALEV